MKISIESTSQIVELNGVPARVWEGTTDSGVPVHCYVTRIACERNGDTAEFDRELQEHRAPTVVLPHRMIL